MRENFYATAAQVIPVLLLVLTLSDEFLLTRVITDDLTTGRVLKPHKLGRGARYGIMLAVVVLLVLGELLAIVSLADPSDHALIRWVVLIALVVGLLAVVVVVSGRARDELGIRQHGSEE